MSINLYHCNCNTAFYALLCVISVVSTFSKVSAQDVDHFVPSEGKVLSGEKARWQARAQAWYTADDLTSKRIQMREMTKALKRPCYYCHTRNFKEYTKVELISLQMMALSHEHKVACADCHVGQKGLTRLGSVSLLMWRYSVSHHKECHDCHQTKQQFKKLKPTLSVDLSQMWHSLNQEALRLKFDPAHIKTLIHTLQTWQKKYQTVKDKDAL